MLDKLQNNDTIITTNNIKNIILKDLAHTKKLLNLKFYTLKEFLDNYYGTPTKEALYFLIKHYHYNYDIAKTYLENIFYDTPELKELKNVLDSNNLITYNSYFKKSLKRVVIIGLDLDESLQRSLSFYNLVSFDFNAEEKYHHQVTKYQTSREEIIGTAIKIRKLLKQGVKLNDICLVNIDNTYTQELQRIFKMFNIPLNLELSMAIAGTKMVHDFLDTLKETQNIEVSLEKVTDEDIKAKLINLFNSYNFNYSLDEAFFNLLDNDIKSLNISLPKYDNAINILNIEDMLDPSKYYFILNFNQGVVPSIYHDDKLIKDCKEIIVTCCKS